jgi:TetR/AcrR family transcriptional regulator
MSEAAPVKLKVSKPRGRRPKAALSGRDALMAAALPAFARLGFDGVDLRTLAAEAGVDASLVGHNFGSKFALWAAVIDQLAEEQKGYAPHLLGFQDRGTPALERLTAFILWFTERSAEKPYLSMLILRESLNPGERLELLMNQLLRPLYLQLEPLLQEVVDQKLCFVSNPARLFFLLLDTISAQIASQNALEMLTGTVDADFKKEVQRNAIAVFARP